MEDKQISLGELFRGFNQVALSGFGGVLPWARRVIVEERAWISSAEFTSLLGLCNFLPGPNVVNLSICIGARFQGLGGAVAAFLGLMLAPFLIIVALGALYGRFGDIPAVNAMLRGVSAVAAGLIVSTGLKMAADLKKRPLLLACSGLVMIGIAVLRWLLQFGLLSLLAFGGANAVIPELHRMVVETNHWMSSAAFAHLFAIAQATPGPNVMIVALIGWHAAGLPGALAAILAICGPSSVLIYAFMRAWKRVSAARWRGIVQTGVAPLAVGLVLASGCVITRAANHTPWAYLLTGIALLISLNFKLNPIWLIVGGALLGLSGAV